MSGAFAAGLPFALASGVTSGTCMLPMKLQQRWRWENFWLVFSIVALLWMPWVLALLLIPRLPSVYAEIHVTQFQAPVLFGGAWGFAQILFGLTIARLGLALGYAIIMGSVAVLGTLVPLVLQGNERHMHALVWFGVAIMLLGIVASGAAGRMKERARTRDETDQTTVAGRYSAVLLAVACGVVSPMLNFSFAFAGDIQEAAIRLGTPPGRAGFAVWPIALSAGFVPNLAYCLHLLSKNKTWSLFRSGLSDVRLPLATAVLWMGSLAMYAMCSASLGRLGTSFGWGIVEALSLVTAGVAGLLLKEWTGTTGTARGLQSAGLLLLLAATLLMAKGIALNK
jgi:L-rhamnose-H+ transport protein